MASKVSLIGIKYTYRGIIKPHTETQEEKINLSIKGKKRVLFVCTHNSSRSQMAEGFLRNVYGERYEVHSAGIEPGQINPLVFRVMSEIGIDTSKHHAKSVNKFLEETFDIVVTVCDDAKESCPQFTGGEKIIHHNFQDPSSIQGTEEEILQRFRTVRDQIKAWIMLNF